MEFQQRRKTISRRILLIIAIIFSIGICSFLAVNLHFILSKDFESLLNIDFQTFINTFIIEKRVLLIFLVLEVLVLSFLLLFSNKRKNIYHSKKVKLTDKIEVPAPAGDGQYGTAWWLQKKDYDKVFKYNIIDRSKDYNESCFKSAGVITNFERNGNLEKIYYVDDNLHTILIGSSGSGKSRSILIPTITMLALASENMLISDVKGELYLYTAPKLKELGYNVIALDFINFLKSSHYNFLDLVINAIEDDNIPLAESLVNDIVNILVEKNDKTEPIWTNGEMSVIKTAIMAVVMENKGKRKYQTLTNAYYFVAEMFKTDEDGEMLIDKYMKNKSADDPIKKFFAVAGTAPSKTRGSFVAAALSTLQMFINEYVADTIQKSDFDLKDFATKKTAIYILLSDDKLTYHKLGSLLVQQLYTAIVDTSRVSGGELPIRMNFILDEFANFTKIDTFQSMLTVSRGRNCRFVIALQSFGQLEEKYGKEGAQNILDNCMLVYLKSNSIETATKISDKLGTYSVQSYGESSNTNIKYDNSSSSMSLISRKMLTPDEVLRIESPVILVMIAGEYSAILYVPDISKMHFNKLNGMGTKEENRLLRIKRENERPTRKISKIKIWNIWDKYKINYEEEFDEEQELKELRENLRVKGKRKE